MSVALRPRSLGEILDGAFRLYRQDIGLFVLTTMLALAPAFFLSLGVISPFGNPAWMFLSFPVAAVLTLALGTSLTVQMDTRLQGGTPELGSSVRRGLRLVFRMLWALVLAYITSIGVFLIPGFAMAMFVGIGASVNDALSVAFGVIAVAVLALVGIWWMGQLFTWLPVMVVEDLPALAALKRSMALARGGWLRVGITFTLVYVLVTIPTVAIYGVTGVFRGFLDPTAFGTMSMGTLVTQQFLSLVASGLTLPFMIACMLLTYYDRRVRTEAYDLEAATEALLES